MGIYCNLISIVLYCHPVEWWSHIHQSSSLVLDAAGIPRRRNWPSCAWQGSLFLHKVNETKYQLMGEGEVFRQHRVEVGGSSRG